MDISDSHPKGLEEVETEEEAARSRRRLPHDLPKSLDDRRQAPRYVGETEMYDAWQGMV